ncbi:MAG: prephenate dehydrogenase [Candidatus Omnitrophota bacterium]
MFNRVAIIGVGLIGGSLGLALKKKRLAKRIIGVARHKRSVLEAKKLNAIDEGSLDVRKALKNADLAVFATPALSISSLISNNKRSIKRGAVLMDVASTKEAILKKIENTVPKNTAFVGAHPLAGSEKNGVRYANADLFKNSICILTRTKKTNAAAFNKMAKLWKLLGARVVVLSAPAHDKILAQVSHLPHIVAVALIKAVDRNSLKFAAGGFRDTTRIAAGEPAMWRDICLTNKAKLVKAIDRYVKAIAQLRKDIAGGNSTELMRRFSNAKNIRDSI